jgi:hypothetical protein
MSRRPLFPPVFAPTVSRPMVDDFSIRAARMRTMQQPSMPSVYSLPQRSHPMWEGNNELGRTAEFAPDSNNRQMILKLGTWGPPKVWTGMLGISFSDSFAANTALLGVTAELQFGAGGVVQQAQIDWNQGVQFSAVMNSLVVTAKFAASAQNIPSDIQLSASVGEFKANGVAPTLSIQVQGLVTGGTTAESSPIRIPAFARRVTVIDSLSAGGAYTSDFSLVFVSNQLATSSGGVVGRIDGATLLNYAPHGVPFPKFANYVIAFARSPLVAVAPTLVFEIDL